jgi:putative SOS response-associated peptidase YedK
LAPIGQDPTFADMCGRYASFLPAEAMRRTFRTVNPLPNLEPSWSVAPTQWAPVVRRHPETGERHLDQLKWGRMESSCERQAALWHCLPG